MSTSYQDIETRLRMAEDKLNFLLKTGTVTKKEPSTIMPGQFISTQMSLGELYREITTNGLTLLNANEQENG